MTPQPTMTKEMACKAALELIRRGGHVNTDVDHPAYVLPDGTRLGIREMCEWLDRQTGELPSIQSLRMRHLRLRDSARDQLWGA